MTEKKKVSSEVKKDKDLNVAEKKAVKSKAASADSTASASENAATKKPVAKKAPAKEVEVADSVKAEKPVAKKAVSSASVSTVKNTIAKPKKENKLKIDEAYVYSTGKRKSSVAKVWVKPVDGMKGFIYVNGVDHSDYFKTSPMYSANVKKPFIVSGENHSSYCVVANVHGGGISAQSQSVLLGIAKAISMINVELRPVFRSAGLLTRDARRVEPKKTGYRKARKKEQYSKR